MDSNADVGAEDLVGEVPLGHVDAAATRISLGHEKRIRVRMEVRRHDVDVPGPRRQPVAHNGNIRTLPQVVVDSLPEPGSEVPNLVDRDDDGARSRRYCRERLSDDGEPVNRDGLTKVDGECAASSVGRVLALADAHDVDVWVLDS